MKSLLFWMSYLLNGCERKFFLMCVMLFFGLVLWKLSRRFSKLMFWFIRIKLWLSLMVNVRRCCKLRWSVYNVWLIIMLRMNWYWWFVRIFYLNWLFGVVNMSFNLMNMLWFVKVLWNVVKYLFLIGSVRFLKNWLLVRYVVMNWWM